MAECLCWTQCDATNTSWAPRHKPSTVAVNGWPLRVWGLVNNTKSVSSDDTYRLIQFDACWLIYCWPAVWLLVTVISGTTTFIFVYSVLLKRKKSFYFRLCWISIHICDQSVCLGPWEQTGPHEQSFLCLRLLWSQNLSMINTSEYLK